MSATVFPHGEADLTEDVKSGVALSDLSGIIRTAGLSSASQAPDLHQALERARQEGLPHVILDGTAIPADRSREKTLSIRGEPIDVWYTARPMSTAVTSRRSSPRTDSRCGSPR
jgi:hypothetical protein